jgi:hypothetical protein
MRVGTGSLARTDVDQPLPDALNNMLHIREMDEETSAESRRAERRPGTASRSRSIHLPLTRTKARTRANLPIDVPPPDPGSPIVRCAPKSRMALRAAAPPEAGPRQVSGGPDDDAPPRAEAAKEVQAVAGKPTSTPRPSSSARRSRRARRRRQKNAASSRRSAGKASLRSSPHPRSGRPSLAASSAWGQSDRVTRNPAVEVGRRGGGRAVSSGDGDPGRR